VIYGLFKDFQISELGKLSGSGQDGSGTDNEQDLHIIEQVQ
jgi:hypothetical protein